MSTGGRPRFPVEERHVEGLARIGATLEEMAGVLGVSEDTLSRHFADTIKRGSAHRKVSLRKVLTGMTLGARPNIAAVIFLAKNILGMSDNQRHELTGKDGAPLPEGGPSALYVVVMPDNQRSDGQEVVEVMDAGAVMRRLGGGEA